MKGLVFGVLTLWMLGACGSDDAPPAGAAGSAGASATAGNNAGGTRAGRGGSSAAGAPEAGQPSEGGGGSDGGSESGSAGAGADAGGTDSGGTDSGGTDSGGTNGGGNGGTSGGGTSGGGTGGGLPVPEIRIQLAPAGVLLEPGASAVFTATVVNSDDEPVAGTVTWESNGEAVTLSPLSDNRLEVTAGTQIDSAQIVARFDEFQAAPVTVAVARPVAGARLVADDEVLSSTEPIDAAQTGDLGTRLHAVIAGEAPSPGQILVGSGKPVAGRVVSSTPATGGHDVVFETVALNELFLEFSIDQTYDVRQLPANYPAGPPASASVTADGSTEYRFDLDLPDYTPPLRLSQNLVVDPEGDFKLGPFYCSVDGGIKPSLSASAISVSVTPNLLWTVDLLVSPTANHFRVLGDGAIDAQVHGPLRLNSRFEGSFVCQAPLVEHPIILPPPIALLVIPTAVGGARLTTTGKIDVNTLELVIDAQVHQPVKLGFQASSTQGVTNLSELDTSQLDTTIEPELQNTTLNSPVRVEAAVGGTLYAQATLTNPVYYAWRRFRDQYPYLSLLDLQSGLNAKLILGTVADQAHDQGFSAGYNINFLVRLGLGADASQVLSHISTLLSLGSQLIPDLTHETTLFAHPVGGSLTYLNGYQVGEQVNFRIVLDPDYVEPELLGYYNVRRVEIWRKIVGGGAELLVGRDALNGEKEFNLVWTADRGGVAKDEIYAFVEPVFGEGFTFKVGPVFGWSSIKQFGGDADQIARALAIDSDGQVVVAGSTRNSLSNAPWLGGASDALWLKYNPIGTVIRGSGLGSGGDDSASDMLIAPDGSFYVVGKTWGGDVGAGDPAFIYAWLMKVNGEGQVQWTKKWATQRSVGVPMEEASGVALGPNGEVYVVSLAGSTWYGNVFDVYCPDPQASQADDCGDVVVSHFDTHGNLLWRQLDERRGMQTSARIAVDSGGNILVTATSYGNIDTDEVPGNEDDSVSLGDPKRYRSALGIWRFDPANGGPPGRTFIKIDKRDLSGNGLTYDAAGNAYVVGNTDGAFDGGVNLGGLDAYVMQLSPFGSANWTKMLATTGTDRAGAVSMAPNGDVLIAGLTDGALYGAPAGGLDAFALRLSSGGGEVWTRQIGGIANDVPYDIGTDRYGNTFLCGSTDGKLSSELLQGFGGRDVFVAKLGPGGTPLLQ
jgi:hypothetical protein